MISWASPAQTCSPLWYIQGLNQTVGRQSACRSGSSPGTAYSAQPSSGTLERASTSALVTSCDVPRSRLRWISAGRSSAAPGSSRSCTMRISEVLPAPHGPLTPMVSGGRVSGWRTNAAIASAWTRWPSRSRMVHRSPVSRVRGRTVRRAARHRRSTPETCESSSGSSRPATARRIAGSANGPSRPSRPHAASSRGASPEETPSMSSSATSGVSGSFSASRVARRSNRLASSPRWTS